MKIYSKKNKTLIFYYRVRWNVNTICNWFDFTAITLKGNFENTRIQSNNGAC